MQVDLLQGAQNCYPKCQVGSSTLSRLHRSTPLGRDLRGASSWQSVNQVWACPQPWVTKSGSTNHPAGAPALLHSRFSLTAQHTPQGPGGQAKQALAIQAIPLSIQEGPWWLMAAIPPRCCYALPSVASPQVWRLWQTWAARPLA